MSQWDSAKVIEGEIVVEVDHPKNSDVFFYPATQSVRSRFIPYRSGTGAPGQLNKYQARGIPGQRIHIHVGSKVGRITDALAEDESFYEELKRDMDTGPKPIRVGVPNRTVVFTGLTDEDVQTWLFWMKRLCTDSYKTAETRQDLGVAGKEIQGKLPTLEEIIGTGKARRPRFHGADGEDGVHYQSKEKKELATAGGKPSNQGGNRS